MDDSLQKLHEVLGSQQQRRVARVALLKMDLAKASIPLENEITSRLHRLFITDFIDAMRSHPGFSLDDKIRSLKTTLDLFKCSHRDLMAALDQFDEFSRSDEFHHRPSRPRHKELEDRIRKELYCFSSLAHSLQDHCRRVTSELMPKNFKERLEIYFGTDGLHDFLCGLRTAMHHRSMTEADWSLKNSGQKMTSHYVLKRVELLLTESWNVKASQWLAGIGDEIDVRTLCDDYQQRVVSFYNWFSTEIEGHLTEAVKDYRTHWNAHMKRSVQMEWRLLLDIFSKAKQRIDPYHHLGKYLTHEEIGEVHRLPMRSKEQVNYIISRVDEWGACNDEIRNAAYRLFGVPLTS